MHHSIVLISISRPHLARAVVTTYGLVRWSLRMRRPGSRGWCAMTMIYSTLFTLQSMFLQWHARLATPQFAHY